MDNYKVAHIVQVGGYWSKIQYIGLYVNNYALIAIILRLSPIECSNKALNKIGPLM